jgi:wobble nucleotide-excising tRNase
MSEADKYITLRKEEYDGLEQQIEMLKEINEKLTNYISKIEEVKNEGGVKFEIDEFSDPLTNTAIHVKYTVIPAIRIATYERS